MKMKTDPDPNAALTSVAFVLPKHLRFACSLALVSGAAVGIAAGASLLTTSGCLGCSGTPCDGQIYVPPRDGAMNTADSGDARDASDASPNSPDSSRGDALGNDAGTGGGPLLAPPLPRAWLS